MALAGLDSGSLRPKIGGRNLQSSQPVPSSRNPLRALVRQAIPDGLAWLASADLAHPEATRAAELPFIFEIGRISVGGKTHTVHEAELVAAVLPEEERELAKVVEVLEAYARFVVATNPTRHARLSGRCSEAFDRFYDQNERSHR